MSVKTNIDQSVYKEVLNCHLREGNMAKKQKNVTSDSVKMSNYLIRAKKQSNLLESKIEVMAIKKLEQEVIAVPDIDPNGVEYTYDGVEFKSEELKKLMGRSGGSFYNNLKEAADRMIQRYIAIEEPETHQFKFRHYYHEVTYSNGTFRVVFENGMQPYLKEISANYTNLSLPILWSFRTNGAFQLYTHLRSYMYNIDAKPKYDEEQEDLECIVKEYKLSELRVDLGFVNLDEDDKIRAEAKKARPNWEKIDNLDKTPKYKRWSDFYTRVIKPGIKEINEKSDIYIKDIEPVKTGKGGKITSIKFYVQYNKKYFISGAEEAESGMRVVAVNNGTDVLEPYKRIKLDELSEIMDIFEYGMITEKQAEILYNDAAGNIDEIRKAYEYTRKIEHIDNFVGYMRKAIKGHYADQENMEVVHGSVEKAEGMNEIHRETASPSIQVKAWEKTTKKEEYPLFIEYLKRNGITEDIFEATYATPLEKLELYSDWIRIRDKEK